MNRRPRVHAVYGAAIYASAIFFVLSSVVTHAAASTVKSPGRLLVGAEIARDDERAAFALFGPAESEIGAAHALVVVDLRVEDLGVPVARDLVIRARVRDVIDAENLQPARRCGFGGRAASREDRGGERHRLAELTAVYLPALKTFDEISDETFHARILPDWRGHPRREKGKTEPDFGATRPIRCGFRRLSWAKPKLYLSKAALSIAEIMSSRDRTGPAEVDLCSLARGREREDSST